MYVGRQDLLKQTEEKKITSMTDIKNIHCERGFDALHLTKYEAEGGDID